MKLLFILTVVSLLILPIASPQLQVGVSDIGGDIGLDLNVNRNSYLSGVGNAYVCVNENGILFRSDVFCV